MTKGPKPYIFLDDRGLKRFAKIKVSIENSGRNKPTIFIKYWSTFKKWIHIELVYNKDAPYENFVNKLMEIDEERYNWEVERLMARAIVEFGAKVYFWNSQEKERNYSRLLESI